MDMPLCYLPRRNMKAVTPQLEEAFHDYFDSVFAKDKRTAPLKDVSSADFKAALKILDLNQKKLAEIWRVAQSTVSNKIAIPSRVTIGEYLMLVGIIRDKKREIIKRVIDAERAGHGVEKVVDEMNVFQFIVVEKIDVEAVRAGFNKACAEELPYRTMIEAIIALKPEAKSYLFKTLELVLEAQGDDSLRPIIRAANLVCGGAPDWMKGEALTDLIFDKDSFKESKDYHAMDLFTGERAPLYQLNNGEYVSEAYLEMLAFGQYCGVDVDCGVDVEGSQEEPDS